jgi:cob(I)alamin adenosyltransferase
MNDDIYLILDETYSAIGSAMCHTDDVAKEKQTVVAEKANQLLRLAKELAVFIEESRKK